MRSFTRCCAPPSELFSTAIGGGTVTSAAAASGNGAEFCSFAGSSGSCDVVEPPSTLVSAPDPATSPDGSIGLATSVGSLATAVAAGSGSFDSASLFATDSVLDACPLSGESVSTGEEAEGAAVAGSAPGDRSATQATGIETRSRSGRRSSRSVRTRCGLTPIFSISVRPIRSPRM